MWDVEDDKNMIILEIIKFNEWSCGKFVLFLVNLY